MDDIVSNFAQPGVLPFEVVTGRLALAALLGGIVGLEREWRQRPAGLRTHILVCLAAATFSILTIEIVHAPMFENESLSLDPIRMVEAVTAGIAFLAAGLILFARGELHGLTTGAGMWLAGAIGVSCGLGLWQIGVFATLLAVLVLGLLQQIEKRFGFDQNKKIGSREDDADSPDQG